MTDDAVTITDVICGACHRIDDAGGIFEWYPGESKKFTYYCNCGAQTTWKFHPDGSVEHETVPALDPYQNPASDD